MRAQLAVLVLLAGCRAELPPPPAGAQIVCASDADCPTGLVCRVSVGQCRQASADQTPPRLVSASVSPAVGNGTVTFIALLEVDEALARPPEVWAEIRGQRLGFALDEAGSNAPSYRFQSRALTAGLEGAAQVFADLVDLDGNPSFAQSVGRFTIDTSPPAVLRASPSAPAYKAGDAVTYQVNVSEPLARPPLVTVRQGGVVVPGVLTTLINQSVASFTFATAVSAFADGAFTVTLSLEDEAGNTALDLAGEGFSVDRTPPVLTLPVVSPLLVREGVQVVATFTVDEALAAPPVVSLGSTPMAIDPAVSPPQYRATAMATLAEGEGPKPVVARISDVAGNLVLRQIDVVTFDFTAPDLVAAATQVVINAAPGASLAAPTALGPGGSMQVLLTMNELGTATLASSPQPVAFSAAAFGPSYVFTGTLAADAGIDGQPQSLTTTLTDLAGNVRPVTLGVGVVLDSVAPGAPLVDDDTHVVYRRVPWGQADGGAHFELVGSLGSVEPSSVVLATDQGGLEIGRGLSTDAGAFLLTLTPADRSVVSLRVVDGAGNESPRRQARNVEWVATLRGKTPGSSNVNPHFADQRADFVRTFDWPNATETALPVALEGQARFLKRSLDGTFPAGSNNTQPSAVDAERQRLVVLKNATGSTNNRPEVWELDLAGGAWTNRTPNPLPPSWPPAAVGAPASTATWDGSRGTLVYPVTAGSSPEVWELDVGSTTWTRRGTAPLLGQAIASAWDEVRRRLVFVFDTPRAVKEWDPVTGLWANLPTLSLTSPRLAFDRTRGGVVAIDDAPAQVYELNATTSTWTPRATSAGPGLLTQRTFTTGVGGNPLLVGVSGGTLPELWEWNSASGTWLNRSAAPRPTPWPATAGATVRSGFDSSRQRLVIFFSNQLWEWTASSGTWLLRSTTGPEARFGHSAVYDSTRETMWSFGGVTPSSGPVNELWEWSPEPGTWVNRTAAGPVARQLSAMVFDEARNRTVLTGGRGVDGGVRNDVWEWNGSTWTERFPTLSPVPRTDSAFVFSTDAGRPVLFGGFEAGFASSDRDLWEWDGVAATWTARGIVSLDTLPPRNFVSTGANFVLPSFSKVYRGPLRCPGTCGVVQPASATAPEVQNFTESVFDQTRQRVVTLFSGPADAGNEVFEYDNANVWRNVTPPVRPTGWPSPRADFATAWDARRGQVVVFGGSVAGTSTAEVWDWGLSTTTRPSATFRFAFSFAQAEAGSTVKQVDARVIGGASGNGVDGVRLCPLEVGAFTCLSSNTAPSTAPTQVAWSSTSPANYFAGARQDFALAVTPAGSNNPMAAARLVVTEVEVLVRYQRP